MRKYLFLIMCSLMISSGLLAQPVEDSTVTKLTPMERVKILRSALEIPSVINSTTGKYKIILDDSWDWLNRAGAYNGQVYFNIFHSHK